MRRRDQRGTLARASASWLCVAAFAGFGPRRDPRSGKRSSRSYSVRLICACSWSLAAAERLDLWALRHVNSLSGYATTIVGAVRRCHGGAVETSRECCASACAGKDIRDAAHFALR